MLSGAGQVVCGSDLKQLPAVNGPVRARKNLDLKKQNNELKRCHNSPNSRGKLSMGLSLQAAYYTKAFNPLLM